MWCKNLPSFPISVRYNTALSLRPLYQLGISYAASRLFYWNMELFAFASRHVAPNIMGHSIRFIRILLCSSLWASVAGRGSRPRCEPPCTPDGVCEVWGRRVYPVVGSQERLTRCFRVCVYILEVASQKHKNVAKSQHVSFCTHGPS